ncbi:Sin3 associated polypeptide p18-domain-containing protein [Choanephora cucurbitarum]|nr:Sin3 associated polypeptide p18-domain-containing protein [Choanephora cucurbitarum]
MTSTVDREKDCPFLLRIFTRHGGHNPLSQYTLDSVPQDELSLYTWKNATLEEIAQLIEQVIPEARDSDARIAFRLIYLDPERARYTSRDMGRVVAASPTEDQKKTLEECKFFIGDYLDVAIFIGPPPAAQLKNNRNRGRFDRFNSGRANNDRFNRRGFGNAPYNRDNGGRFARDRPARRF